MIEATFGFMFPNTRQPEWAPGGSPVPGSITADEKE